MRAEDVISTYARVAHQWAADRNKDLFEQAWLDRMLDLATPPDGRSVRVLELGGGAGRPIGVYLEAQDAEVTATDAVEPMVELYRQAVPSARAFQADMRHLDLGERFDAILAWDSFFHLCVEDQRAMFATFAVHAAPGAALMFTSGPEHGEAIGEVGGEPIYHASLDPDEYRELLVANGFTVVAFTPEDPTCARRSVWLAQFGPATS